MGANAASAEPEKTIVLVNLVPRGEKFDNNTSLLTSEKFWHKQISIKASYFGSYDVLYVVYPGTYIYRTNILSNHIQFLLEFFINVQPSSLALFSCIDCILQVCLHLHQQHQHGYLVMEIIQW